MSERENGQLPPAKPTVRSRVSADVWEQTKTAYASGIPLRELARNMGIPAGTILSRAKREGWSRPRNNAKALAKRDDTAKVITPFEVASATGCRICYTRMLTRDVYQMTWCLVPPAGDKSSHQTERNSGD